MNPLIPGKSLIRHSRWQSSGWSGYSKHRDRARRAYWAGEVLVLLGTVSYIADSTCTTIGLVRSKDPSAGTAVPSGSAVSVTIVKVPPPPSLCP